jgi:hypothetical protein
MICERNHVEEKLRKVAQICDGFPIQEIGTLSVVATPEPSTWAMLVLGFAGLGLVGRRRQRSARLAPSLG